MRDYFLAARFVYLDFAFKPQKRDESQMIENRLANYLIEFLIFCRHFSEDASKNKGETITEVKFHLQF
jgi:hypothetical protein